MNANKEVAELIGGPDFERTQQNWWHFFETTYKKDLEMCNETGLFKKVGCIPIEGLFQVVEGASHELARSTRGLIENMIRDTELLTGERPNVSSKNGCLARTDPLIGNNLLGWLLPV